MSFITTNQLYSSRDMKVEAKAQLKGHWRDAMLLGLIPVVFSIFFVNEVNPDTMMQMSTGRMILNASLRLIHGFMLTSVSFTFLDFLRTRQGIAPLAGAIQAFRKEYFVNLLLLKIVKYFYTILWTFVFIIPGIVKGFSYSQAELIFKDTVDRTGEIPKARDCIKQSEAMMKGHKMDLFSLGISFIGWYVLAFLTFGILFVWLTPYIEMSQVVFYQNLLQKNSSAQVHGSMNQSSSDPLEEVGKDPDDFSDFTDF